MGLGWLGPVAGALIGGLFEQNSAASAYSNQMEMLDKQMAFSRESMQNHHQWEVSDLQAAGLNPLLSVSSPTGTLSSPSPSQVQKANISSSAAALGQLALNKEQIDVNKAQVKVQDKMAEAALTNADAAMQDSQANMIRANNDTTMVDFHVGKEFTMRSGLTDAQIDNLVSSTGLSNSQTALNILKYDWLPDLLQADLNEKQMKIATGYLVAKAQDYYYRASGDANLTNAAANLSRANSYSRFVDNCELVGISEANLKDKQALVAIETANGIIQDNEHKVRMNGMESDLMENDLGYASYKTGMVMGNFFGNGRASAILNNLPR